MDNCLLTLTKPSDNIKMMKGQTTSRQKELLHFIYEYVAGNSYSPTLEEMRNYLGVVSNQAVLDLLKKLESQGLIRKDASISRSISILERGYKILGKNPSVAVLGTTSAGAPMEMVEISGEWETTPESDVAKFKDNVFLLKISGDSMIGAGIEDGDMVLAQEQKEFVSGDIVLARIRDESTIKRFISEDRPPYIYLKPENPKYENILFTDETTIVGKVISVLKNGYWSKIK
ncbi:MAG: transcriptional repressor LexA [Patescibacteria group bacterium]